MVTSGGAAIPSTFTTSSSSSSSSSSHRFSPYSRPGLSGASSTFNRSSLSNSSSSSISSYILYTDGGSRGNPGQAGCGGVLYKPDGITKVYEFAEYLGVKTNNEAEYAGFIFGLKAALSIGVTHLEVRCDSKLVVCQVTDEWKVRQPHIVPLVQLAKSHMKGFDSFTANHVRREQNSVADQLANQAMDRKVSICQ